jgi:hypothetical protein
MVINMAHYAFLDKNNVVTEVIVGKDEGEDGINWEQHYGNFRGQLCKRTSYNASFRKHYAGIGYTYNSVRDAFVPPQPYQSWILDDDANWQPPVAMPTDEQRYVWNETTQTWDVMA